MIGIDTNILAYARIGTAPEHPTAARFLEELWDNREVVISELVLVELYILLRNERILTPALSAGEAVRECNVIRAHPHWQLVDSADVMNEVWSSVARFESGRRHIFDIRLAKTLQAHGVTEFATANLKDFENLGFKRVWNPLAP